MLLSLVLILLLIGAAVVGSLYSNFIVFYKSFAETENYNKAYYTSIAALERGELVVKQREPGYVGSGGWRGTEEINLEGSTDKIDAFSYIGESSDTNLLWDVNSSTNRIPREGEGDVDRMLSSTDSTNYNKMDYENAEVFLLYKDDLEGSPYQKKSCLNTADCDDIKANIVGEIRLPQKMVAEFGPLDTTKSLTYTSNNGNKNDEIVDWQIRGKHNGNQFTIFARNKGDQYDSVIKESDINNTVNLDFGDTNHKFRQPSPEKSANSSLILISSDDSITSIDTKPNKFSDVLEGDAYSRLNLRLALLNLLKATTSGMIYPYLEYYLSFSNDVPDKYFKIDAEGRYKDYQVNIIVHKPTVKESVLGNFTVIF